MPAAEAIAVKNKWFLGNTRRGGSCNVEEYRLIPHCHGTHTECVGHIVDEAVYINKILNDVWIPAIILSIEPVHGSEIADRYSPEKARHDKLIGRNQIDEGFHRFNDKRFHGALIIRTLPNERAMKKKHYTEAAYFSNDAMKVISRSPVKHLLVDLPSVDRMDDQGKLSNHRIFWNVTDKSTHVGDASLSSRTITELIFVADEVEDGYYFLNLQIASFDSDAAPSRPIVFAVNNP